MSSSVDSDDFTMFEQVIGNVKDFRKSSNEMQEVSVGDLGKCILIKNIDGTFSAIGTKCTHYGAPLIKGSLRNGKVQCPWHGACFNAKTGDIEDYPGLDSLASFPVYVDDENGDIRIKASRKALKEGRRNVCTSSIKQTIGESDHVVIIGGGASSQVAAETLRCHGFGGKITILSAESHPPYDRAKLSKALDVDPQKIYLRKDEKFYRDINVNVVLNLNVTHVDTLGKTIACNGSQSIITYDKLIVATGGQPRTLNPIKGWDLGNVFAFRTVHDANNIAKAAQDGHVVVVGSSFIGMEVASYLTSRKLATSVSVVCGKRSKVPFQSTLGEFIGTKVMKMHEEKGVKFYPLAGVKELVGENGSVQTIILTNGTSIKADVVILGIGVTPSTEFLKSSKILVDDKGYVPVDGKMRTSEPSVYAVGDIVTFPLQMKDGERVNIQHWQMAHKHGQIAAKDIVDSYLSNYVTDTKTSAVESVPFFWTVQYGTSIRYAGYSHGYSEVVIATPQDGVVAIETQVDKFCVFYFKGETAIAIATVKCDPFAAKFAQSISSGKILKQSMINEFMKE